MLYFAGLKERNHESQSKWVNVLQAVASQASQKKS